MDSGVVEGEEKTALMTPASRFFPHEDAIPFGSAHAHARRGRR
jgi:hypothetical protein